VGEARNWGPERSASALGSAIFSRRMEKKTREARQLIARRINYLEL
jgi:hypothetical protein